MDDRQLRSALMDELDFEPSLDATNIGVLVEGQVVTLTGYVPALAQKLAAEAAAWRVKGVRAVVPRIEVRLEGDPPADEEIARRALGLLHWDSTVPSGVRLSVERGWQTLAGQVAWKYQRDNAEIDVQRLSGLVGVTNNIEIVPEAREPALRERIEAALRRNAKVEAARIRIGLRDGGWVTLEGSVASGNERDAVARAAWSAPGVRHVVDRLRVEPV